MYIYIENLVIEWLIWSRVVVLCEYEHLYITSLCWTTVQWMFIKPCMCQIPRDTYVPTVVIFYKTIRHPIKVWKGIRVTMLFDLLTCIMQCYYIQCMIIQCLIFLLQFQFDFITFHFFFLQSCFRAFDICHSSMQDFHCAMRYAILRTTIIHTPSCHYSYFVMPSLLRLCLLQLYIQMALHS